MKTITIAIGILSLTFVFACKKDPMLGGSPIAEVMCDGVTYAAVIQPLFVRTCGGSDCHSAGAPDGAITNYNNTKRYVNNGDIKKLVLDTREMPIGFTLTSEELGQVKCWLDAGAPNN